jgi:hypothetical protein
MKDNTMNDDFYTLAYWKVKENKEMEFKDIWEKELAPAFLAVNPYAVGTLIQSLENPHIFYSFGPWTNLTLMQNARANEKVRAVITKLASLCDEAQPGSFKKILSVSGNKQ